MDITFINPPQSTANFSGSSSLLTHNTGALPLEPGDFLELHLLQCIPNTYSNNPNGKFNVAIMGYYQ